MTNLRSFFHDFSFVVLFTFEKCRHQIAKDRKEEGVHPLWSGFIQASGFFGENKEGLFLDLFATREWKKGKKAVLLQTYSALLCVSYIESRSMMVVFTARGVFRKQ